MNCGRCGTPMYKYERKYYCPNCDPKPFLDEEEKENKKETPGYLG